MLRNRWAKALLFVLCLAPMCWLSWQAWRGNLTANPIEFITHSTGEWTIRFIVFTLTVTPLRRLFRQPDLARFRRMLGLSPEGRATFAWVNVMHTLIARSEHGRLVRRSLFCERYLFSGNGITGTPEGS